MPRSGMVAVVAAGDADAVIAALNNAGETAAIIGHIIAEAKGCDVVGSAGSWGSATPWTASHNG